MTGATNGASLPTSANLAASAPPRLAQALLMRVLPSGIRQDVIGDLCERYWVSILPRRGRKGARRWFWAQTLRATAPLPGMALREGWSSQRAGPGKKRGDSFMQILLQDVRFGLRTLWKNPAYAIVAVVTLALGIGANTAIFSAVNGVLLQPLPYGDPGRLMHLTHRARAGSYSSSSTTPANFYSWQADNRSFEGLAAYSYTSRTLTGRGDPRNVLGVISCGSVLQVLGVPPAQGRVFTREEDQPGGEAVIVLSHGGWRHLFNGDPDTVGKTLVLQGIPFAVIGIMPAGFYFPDEDAEYWIPARFSQEFRANASQYFLRGVGRLAAGQTIRSAEADLERVMLPLRQSLPQYNGNVEVAVQPLREQMVGGSRAELWVLMGAVTLVLLIGCANIAHLLLARAAARRHEIVMRRAMGASQTRIVRQLLTESLLIGLSGGLVGIVSGFAFLRLVTWLAADRLPRTGEIGIDATVLAFTFVLAAACGVVFGLVPAWQASTSSEAAALRSSGRMSRRAGWTRPTLVVSEIALAVILVVGAGLLLRSFWSLTRVDPGIETEGVLTFSLEVPSSWEPSAQSRLRFFEDIEGRLRSIPGVQRAARTSYLPVAGRGVGAWFNILDRPLPADQTPPAVPYRVVSPGYFRTLGIPLVRGRDLTERDGLEGSPAIVINQALADRYWPDEDPLGKQVVLGPLQEGLFPPARIVGIVRNVRNLGLGQDYSPVVYAPHKLMPYWDSFYFALKTTLAAGAVMPAARKEIHDVDGGAPIERVRTMREVIDRTTTPARSSMLLLGTFAALALAMSAVGVFGVLSYSVAQRTRELGIRMALGATSGGLRSLIVRQSLMQACLGVALGLAASWAVTRWMEGLLFSVAPTDPMTFAWAAAVLAAVAVSAGYFPARRAAAVDPAQVLRAD